jgi:hypoxanthine phosphoribosyltransferase
MEEIQIEDKVFVPYIGEENIACRVRELAEQINHDLKGREVLFISVLNGAFIFAADLYRQVDLPSRISFIKLSSYEGNCSAGTVKELIGMEEDLEGKNVVILEDIIDTGTTLKDLVTKIYRGKPQHVYIAALFFKPEVYTADLPVDYIGVEIPDDFIIGYGLDYNGYGRNLPSVYKSI